MAAARRGMGPSLGTGALVLVFALLGAGAALLAGHAPSFVHGASSGIDLRLPNSIWAVLFLAPLLIGFLSYVLRWAVSSPASMPTRVGVSVAVAAAVCLVLVGMLVDTNWNGDSHITYGAASSSGPGGNGTGTGHGNSTQGNGTSGGGSGNGGTNGTGGSNSSGSGNGSGSGGGNSSGPGGGGGGGPGGHGNGTGNNSSGAPLGTKPAGGASLGIANWEFLAIAAALSVVVGLLAIPGMLSRLVDRRSRRGGVGAGTSLSLLAPPPSGAVQAPLALGPESPRESIVRLYGLLVGKLTPAPGDLTTLTAEEIQRTRFLEMHVSSASSTELTRMFEEACYSTHPIGSPDAERFVATMHAVERDLFVAGAPE